MKKPNYKNSYYHENFYFQCLYKKQNEKNKKLIATNLTFYMHQNKIAFNPVKNEKNNFFKI